MTPDRSDPVTRQVVQTERAAQTIAMITPTLAVLTAGMAVAFAFVPGGQRSAVYVGCFTVVALVAYAINRRGKNRLAAILLVTMMVLAPALEPLATGDLSTNTAFAGITGVLALMLIEWRDRWWVLGAVAGVTLVTIVRTDPELTVPVTRVGSAVSGTGLLVLSLITGMWLLRSYHTMIVQAAGAQRLAEANVRELAEVNASLATAVATREAELAAAIEARRRLAEHLAEAAVRDPLTGLHNRRYLDRQLPTWGRPAAVALLDVDHFKSVNDTYTYEVGDQVLRGIASTLSAHTGPHTILIRYGGEEFAVLFPQAAAGDAVDAAERLRLAVADMTWDHLQPGLEVTISVGLCAGDHNPPDDAPGAAVDMLACADQALTRAKGAGRNRTAISFCHLP